MIIWLVQQLLALRKYGETALTPHHVAIAVTLGMILGVLPKGNLLAVAVTVGILSLRVNLAIVIVTILGCSFAAPLLDPITNAMGVSLLTHEGLQATWERLHTLPFVPWMSLNNSVVLGSFVLGIAASVPTYLALYVTLRSLARRRARTDADIEVPSEASDAVSEIQQAA